MGGTATRISGARDERILGWHPSVPFDLDSPWLGGPSSGRWPLAARSGSTRPHWRLGDLGCHRTGSRRLYSRCRHGLRRGYATVHHDDHLRYSGASGCDDREKQPRGGGRAVVSSALATHLGQGTGCGCRGPDPASGLGLPHASSQLGGHPPLACSLPRCKYRSCPHSLAEYRSRPSLLDILRSGVLSLRRIVCYRRRALQQRGRYRPNPASNRNASCGVRGLAEHRRYGIRS